MFVEICLNEEKSSYDFFFFILLDRGYLYDKIFSKKNGLEDDSSNL